MMNRQLHGERIVRGTHRRRLHRLPWADLPDGAFVLLGTSPTIVIGDQLTEWTREGYQGLRARPMQGTVDVITPSSTLAALRASYRVRSILLRAWVSQRGDRNPLWLVEPGRSESWTALGPSEAELVDYVVARQLG
jgi:hypothetical protein